MDRSTHTKKILDKLIHEAKEIKLGGEKWVANHMTQLSAPQKKR